MQRQKAALSRLNEMKSTGPPPQGYENGNATLPIFRRKIRFAFQLLLCLPCDIGSESIPTASLSFTEFNCHVSVPFFFNDL